MLGAAKVKETKIIGTTAEGDRVAIESRGNFEFEDGRVYRNSYHHLFIVRDNQVVKVHEYLDTALTARVFQPQSLHFQTSPQHTPTVRKKRGKAISGPPPQKRQ